MGKFKPNHPFIGHDLGDLYKPNYLDEVIELMGEPDAVFDGLDVLVVVHGDKAHVAYTDTNGALQLLEAARCGRKQGKK